LRYESGALVVYRLTLGAPSLRYASGALVVYKLTLGAA